jgi:hypothetical protein
MKKLAVCMFSFLSILSLCSAVEVQEAYVNEKVTLNFSFEKWVDIEQAVQSLLQAIPIVFEDEVGTDEAKKAIILDINTRLDQAMKAGSLQPIIQQLFITARARSMELQECKQLSLSEFVTYVVEGLKMVEDAHLFGALHTFLLSVDGQELLHAYENALSNGLRAVPTMLLLFYTFRELAYGQQEDGQYPVIEFAQ